MNVLLNTQTEFIDLGLIDYQEAWDYQTKLFQSILDVKSGNRSLPDDQHQQTKNYLLFCEHPHVYTLGKSGDEQNLLIKKENLSDIGATYYHINRGGDITYHGPGQLVVYPVIDMENFFTDIHKYMRLLEESVILTLKELGIPSTRVDGLTGVWLGTGKDTRKICALGVKTSRWVTMHGLALNVNSQLGYFDRIIPCGINDKAVTSVEKELGKKADMDLIKSMMKQNIATVFGMHLV